MSYQDEAESAAFSRPEVLIAITCAATGKLLQEISLPAVEFANPYSDVAAESDDHGTDVPARISQ